MSPLLLDLFSCQGGASSGYVEAGFDVIGVDHRPQPHYPFAFEVADLSDPATILGLIARHRPRAVHASPPCQRFTQGLAGNVKADNYPDLVASTRAALAASGLPYVIENVPRAPLLNPLTLCGTEFGLTTHDDDGSEVWLRRHRLFESNVTLMGAGGCHCASKRGKIAGVYGGARSTREGAKERKGGYTPSVEVARRLLGVPWMTLHGAQQCIPPAYAAFIGGQLLESLT